MIEDEVNMTTLEMPRSKVRSPPSNKSLLKSLVTTTLMTLDNIASFFMTMSAARSLQATRDMMDEQGLMKEAQMFHGLARANRPPEWEKIFESVKFWKEMENDDNGTTKEHGPVPNMQGTDTGSHTAPEGQELVNNKGE